MYIYIYIYVSKDEIDVWPPHGSALRLGRPKRGLFSGIHRQPWRDTLGARGCANNAKTYVLRRHTMISTENVYTHI